MAKFLRAMMNDGHLDGTKILEPKTLRAMLEPQFPNAEKDEDQGLFWAFKKGLIGHAGGGQDVPYFLKPDLGGHQALRGYSSFRFRDRSSLLLTGEYRWSAGPLVDMALFADAGTVAPRLEAVSLGDLHTSYGIGFTLHTPSTTFTRIELARSREGLGLLVSFGPSF